MTSASLLVSDAPGHCCSKTVANSKPLRHILRPSRNCIVAEHRSVPDRPPAVSGGFGITAARTSLQPRKPPLMGFDVQWNG